MAYFDTVWYCGSVGYAAVSTRPQNAAVVAGALCRQFTTPAVGSERVFVCRTAGTTANTTDATWTLTRGASTTDGTVTWTEVTGMAAMNGDATNTPTWSEMKAISTPSLGVIIKNNGLTSYQICTTAGTLGASEPAFSDTAGTATSESGGAATWRSLGLISSFTGGRAPFARLQSAFGTSWFAAGNTVFVSNNHAEAQTTAITLTPLSSGANINKILCHNSAGSYPPTSSDLTTGAVISTTGAANIAFTPAAGGTNYFYGVTFRVGVGQTANNTIQLNLASTTASFDHCSFEIATTNASPAILVGSTSNGVLVLNSTTVKFANVGQKLTLQSGMFLWQNTGQILVSGSSVPTTLISCTSATLMVMVLEALDLSQLTGSLIAPDGGTNNLHCTVRDCKLHASTTVTAPTGSGVFVQFARSSA